MMSIDVTKNLIDFCKDKRVKLINYNQSSGLIVEFFEEKTDTTFDAKKLTESLTDSLPPDSEMLFASVPDPLQTTDEN